MKGGGGKETCTAPFIRFLLRLTALYFLYTLHLLLTPTSSKASSCLPDTASSFSTLVSWVSANFTATAASGTPPAAATATTLQHFMSGIAASSRFWDKQDFCVCYAVGSVKLRGRRGDLFCTVETTNPLDNIGESIENDALLRIAQGE